MLLVEVIGPVLVHRHQAVEILFVAFLADDQLGLGVLRLRGLLGRRLRGLDVFLGGLRRVLVLGALELEDRVLLQLLFDAFLEGHDRQLQDLHRLDHARSQNHLLLQPHR